MSERQPRRECDLFYISRRNVCRLARINYLSVTHKIQDKLTAVVKARIGHGSRDIEVLVRIDNRRRRCRQHREIIVRYISDSHIVYGIDHIQRGDRYFQPNLDCLSDKILKRYKQAVPSGFWESIVDNGAECRIVFGTGLADLYVKCIGVIFRAILTDKLIDIQCQRRLTAVGQRYFSGIHRTDISRIGCIHHNIGIILILRFHTDDRHVIREFPRCIAGYACETFDELVSFAK